MGAGDTGGCARPEAAYITRHTLALDRGLMAY
jgi:hypothetical protein